MDLAVQHKGVKAWYEAQTLENAIILLILWLSKSRSLQYSKHRVQEKDQGKRQQSNKKSLVNEENGIW